MHPGDASQTDNLPMYHYDDDGETQLSPCAEIYLTEKGGRKLFGQGLIALWSVKNLDAVKLSDFNALTSAINCPIYGVHFNHRSSWPAGMTDHFNQKQGSHS